MMMMMMMMMGGGRKDKGRKEYVMLTVIRFGA